jgi:hypothetical protein
MIRKLHEVSSLITAGDVRLGMTRRSVIDLLGSPDSEGGTSRKYKLCSIYRYGDVQFIFPQAKTHVESESQGLLYVYVDDGIKGVDEPMFLLE